MALSNRDELIRELGRNFKVEVEPEEEEELIADANGHILSTGEIERMKRMEALQKKAGRYDFPVQTENYTDIITGRRTFMVMKDVGYMGGDSLVVREYDNLRATGNMTIKIINRVEKGVVGIEDGYCVISWE